MSIGVISASLPPIGDIPSGAVLNLRETSRRVAAFRASDDGRAAFELVVTAAPLAFLWFLMWLTFDLHYGLTLLLSVPAAGCLLRLFLIQHDCGHGAFFK